MPPDLSLRLKNDYGELPRLKSSVKQYCEVRQLPSNIVFAILLSLDELVTNIITYAWDDAGEHFISVVFSSGTGLIEIDVEDDGAPFNPLEYEPPDLMSPIEERHIGGLGIHLVQTYMDDISYTRADGKNRLHLKKRL